MNSKNQVSLEKLKNAKIKYQAPSLAIGRNHRRLIYAKISRHRGKGVYTIKSLLYLLAFREIKRGVLSVLS